MVKKILFTLFFLSINYAGFSQPSPSDLQLLKDAMGGIQKVAASLIADSFSPMTHYENNQNLFQIVPLYFKVEELGSDSVWKTKDLKGQALGAGLGHAFSQKLLGYAIATFLSLKGEAQSTLMAKPDYQLFALSTGLGYDLLAENQTFSLPVFAGITLQYYNTKIDLPDFTTASSNSNLEGQGLLFGLSAGIAFSAKLFDTFKVTPYLLFLQNLNQPTITAKTNTTIPFPITVETELALKQETMGMFGLNIGFIASDNWDISLILGGTLSSVSQFYNDIFLNGLRIQTYGLSITYKN